MARKHVLYEFLPENARPPVGVVFIGEGPGMSEDMLGTPFIGPAGRVLRDALPDPLPVPVALCNMVVCRPQDHPCAVKNRKPSVDEMEACSDRLAEFLRITSPRVVVMLGALPQQFAPLVLDRIGYHRHRLNIHHPAYFLYTQGIGSPFHTKWTGLIHRWLDNAKKEMDGATIET